MVMYDVFVFVLDWAVLTQLCQFAILGLRPSNMVHKISPIMYIVLFDFAMLPTHSFSGSIYLSLSRRTLFSIP